VTYDALQFAIFRDRRWRTDSIESHRCVMRNREPIACGVWRLLTFFSAGSWTVSASLLRAFRICEAATLVDVFSKAYIACLVSNPFIFVQIAPED
jgi:hypothetical protein